MNLSCNIVYIQYSTIYGQAHAYTCACVRGTTKNVTCSILLPDFYICFFWYRRRPLYLITCSLGVRLLALTWLFFIANGFSSRIQCSLSSRIKPGGPVWFVCTRVHTCTFNTKICTCAKNTTTKNQQEIQSGCAFIRNLALTCVYRCGYGSTYSATFCVSVGRGTESKID